jgi:O-antigen ligase
VLGLSLAEGGFGVTGRHIAGLVVWLVVLLLLAFGAGSRARMARPFYWAGGLILALALFSALSSLWSYSAELSVIEADRVLVYLGVFVAAFLIAQTEQSRQRFGEGIGSAIAVVALIALASRVIPHVFTAPESLGSGPRLLYPLGYWNADGSMFALGAVFALWMSRRSLTPILRWLAVAALPILLVALYFTFSRGGILALAVGVVALLALSHDRLWLLGTTAIGLLAALPAVIEIQANSAIANNAAFPGVIGQGARVGLLVLAGIVLALVLFAGLRALERRGGALTGRALTLSRDRRVLRGVTIAAALIAIGAAIAVGGRAWNQFSTSELKVANPSERLSDFTGAGRHEFYRVAIDAWEEAPIFGHGAGTYRFSWQELRHQRIQNQLAHSLYLQAFAELGLVGGILVLAIVLLVLWQGLRAWRAASGRQQELFAVFFAVALAFAVGAAIDWLWEISALTNVFFLVGGALVAGRCAQLVGARAGANGRGELESRRRFGLVIVGVVLAWVTALALVGPLLADRELDSSDAAVSAGNLAQAADHADTARSIEPWAASPYLQLGVIAEAEENYPAAIERLTQAIEREDHDWVLYFVRGRIHHEAGETAAAAADLRRAKQLNPLEPCLGEGWDAC